MNDYYCDEDSYVTNPAGWPFAKNVHWTFS
jgi:hypothetical protein